MIWQISWRNVWRKKGRSLTIVGAITLGMIAGLFSTAFMNGVSEQRIASAIKNEFSHIQIHQPHFKDNYDTRLYIQNPDSVIEVIRKNYPDARESDRLVIFSMANTAETGTGVKIVGVNPEMEQEVSGIPNEISEGDYLPQEKQGRNMPIVIGKELAEKLHARLGSKIVISLQKLDGSLTGGAFRVCGLYDLDNNAFEKMNVFVRKSDLADLTGIPKNASHEIAIFLHNDNEVENVKTELSRRFKNLEVQSWSELSPELGYMTSVMDQYMYIFIVIILLALCFGIVNTMLMAVLERVKELGMLMAIGMNRRRIFAMIMLETVFLVMTGGFTGIVLGTLISKYFEYHAIDLSMYSEGLSDIGYSSVTYTALDPQMIIIVGVLVIITGLFSAIFPAVKALKLNPSEAIRTE